MGIRQLNHAVLYVRDAARSATFYEDVLGFSTVLAIPGGAFLRAPESTTDHDVAFYSIGESLDLAKLDSRVTTLINAFGTAIP